MDNLLPKFTHFASLDEKDSDRITPNDTVQKYLEWSHEATIVNGNSKLPYGLIDKLIPPSTVLAPQTSVHHYPPPNERYIEKNAIYDESPLINNNNLVATIALPKQLSDLNSVSHKTIRVLNDNKPLMFNLLNMSIGSMDLFMQKSKSILSYEVKPYNRCSKLLDGETESLAPEAPVSTLNILCSTSDKLIVTMSVRQLVKEYIFNRGPIGIEAEYLNDTLVCTKCFEDSQAYPYRDELEGVQIISVNDVRVQTLHEFQSTVKLGQSTQPKIRIRALIYKDAKTKVDELHAQALRNNQKNITKLLSHIMINGIDTEHQHEISLPSSNQIDDEDEDDTSNMIVDSKDIENKDESKDAGNKSDSKEIEKSIEYKHENVDDKMHDRSSIENHEYIDEEDGLKVTVMKSHRNVSITSYDIDEEKSLENVSVIDVAESKTLDENSTSVDDTKSWNYATAVPEETDYDIGPYNRLVCIPELFSKSKYWGAPDRYLQISNYSNKLDLHIYWIDDDSCLIPRTIVKTGIKHNELTSAFHTWLIIAAPKLSKMSYNEHTNLNLVNKSYSTIIVKPCKTSLAEGKCTNMLWIPNQSLTAVRNLYPKSVPRHKTKEGHVNQDDMLLPHMHLQVMDPK